MSKIYDMIIIGGGPAGYTAALYGARAGLSTLIIEKMTIGGQMTETGNIDNYPGFAEGIDGISLGMQMQAGAERFGAETVYDEVVGVSLKEEIKKIETAFSGEFSAKTVIIATGAGPRKMGLDGEENFTGQGIHYCAHCDGRFYKDKVVVVVGGGNTAVGDALYLSNLAKKVYLVHRRNSFRASKVLTDALYKAENIELVLDSKPAGILSNGTLYGMMVENVATGEKRELLTDGIFVSIGRVPATGLFKGQIPMDESGYIIAGENTGVGVDGVFAAGDVRTKALRQVITAASDGAVAAHFAGEYLSEKK